jgi:hypothetical protein
MCFFFFSIIWIIVRIGIMIKISRSLSCKPRVSLDRSIRCLQVTLINDARATLLHLEAWFLPWRHLEEEGLDVISSRPAHRPVDALKKLGRSLLAGLHVLVEVL